MFQCNTLFKKYQVPTLIPRPSAYYIPKISIPNSLSTAAVPRLEYFEGRKLTLPARQVVNFSLNFCVFEARYFLRTGIPTQST